MDLLHTFEKFTQRSPFALAILLNLVLFATHLAVADLHYFSEKEVEWVSRIVTGTWFTPNANTLLNNFLVLLYSKYPHYSWYSIIITSTLFPSYVGISYLFFSRKTNYQGLFLYVLFFLMFGFFANSRVNVEIAAGFSALSGILLVILGGDDDGQSTSFKQILGAVLATWSGVLSWTAFGLMLMVVLPFWIIRLQKVNQAKSLLSGALLALVVLFSLGADWYSYHSSTNNSDIMREQVLSALRNKISTVKLTEKELTNNLAKAGISLNDYEMLKKDFMLNDKKVNIRSMSAFLANQSWASEVETLCNYFRNLSQEMHIRKLFGFSLIFLGISILFVSWNTERIRILITTNFAAIVWLFLFYSYSYTNLDSSFLTPVIMYLSLIPSLILITDENSFVLSKSKNVLFVTLFFITMASVLIASTNPVEKSILNLEREKGRKDWLQLETIVKNNPNQLFVVWGKHHFENYFNANETIPFLGEKNVLWLKNDQQSKKTNERLEIFFLKELPYDFMKNEHSFLVLPNQDYEELKNLMITYFSEHHSLAVRLELMYGFRNFSVVRVQEY